MKIYCDNCKSPYDAEQNDNICPVCGAFNETTTARMKPPKPAEELRHKKAEPVRAPSCADIKSIPVSPIPDTSRKRNTDALRILLLIVSISIFVIISSTFISNNIRHSITQKKITNADIPEQSFDAGQAVCIGSSEFTLISAADIPTADIKDELPDGYKLILVNYTYSCIDEYEYNSDIDFMCFAEYDDNRFAYSESDYILAEYIPRSKYLDEYNEPNEVFSYPDIYSQDISSCFIFLVPEGTRSIRLYISEQTDIPDTYEKMTVQYYISSPVTVASAAEE